MKATVPSTVVSDARALLSRITSSAATRYRLIKAGHQSETYVYCALDTLEYAFLSPGMYQVIAEPPVGPDIHFGITPTGPELSDLWMSTVMPAHTKDLPPVQAMPSRCCPYMHFFASREAYEVWLHSLPENFRPYITLQTLTEAWALARRSLAACKCR